MTYNICCKFITDVETAIRIIILLCIELDEELQRIQKIAVLDLDTKILIKFLINGITFT